MHKGRRDSRRRRASSRQLQRTSRERLPAPFERGPLAGLAALEDLVHEEVGRLALGLALAEHPAARRDRNQDQVLAVLGAGRVVEQSMQLGAVPAEGAGAELRREVEPPRVDRGHAVSNVAPTLFAASPISFQVVSSISIPSAMRCARAMRSGSPGTSTGSAGSAAWVAFIYAISSSTSVRRKLALAMRPGSITTVSMPLRMPRSRGFAGWMVPAPTTAPASSSQISASA